MASPRKLERRFAWTELEHYLAGTASPELAERIDRQRDRDSQLREWLESREQAREAFSQDPRRPSFAQLVEGAGSGAAHRRWPWSRPALAGVVATAAAAALFVWLRPVTDQVDGIAAGGGTAVRGGVAAKVAVLRDGERSIFEPGGILFPGDRIRLSIDDPEGGYLVVISQSSSCLTRTAYSVEEVGRLTPGTHVLPGSLELDDKLGKERLYVLLAPSLPAGDAWQESIQRSCQQVGFDHDWRPQLGVRLSVIDFDKRPRP